MLSWITENIGTIIVGAILILVVIAIIIKIIKDKKQGKTSCGCGCSTCSMEGSCHKSR